MTSFGLTRSSSRQVLSGLSFLGESTRDATLYMLEQESELKLSQIPENPQRFLLAMRRMFEVGAGTILHSILTELEKVTPESDEEKRGMARFAGLLEETLRSTENGIA